MPVVKSYDRAESQQVEYLDQPDKSENDKKEYRAIRLPNGLEALLISDEYLTTSSSEEKKAACSLCVNVGNFSDPPEFPGISNVVGYEYMFFREYKKNLECTSLQNFIFDHGGTTNVTVNDEDTMFYFDIKENNLLLALHKFGLFFVNITPKHIFMELINFVKNEFQMLFVKTRYEHLFSSFAQTGHPANKFPADHIIKLRNNVDSKKLYNTLNKFKKRHYSAHRMKLVIRSGLPLDTMEKFVKACFADVPNNRMPPDNFAKFKNDLPFDTPAFRKMYKVKNNLQLLERLVITWALPSFSDFYKCNSYRYIPKIIGYEGKGSLISYLRRKMWSSRSENNIFYCENEQNSLYSLIELTIPLTSEGQKHLEDVLDAIFSFINLLKTADPQRLHCKEIYNDIYETNQNIFSYNIYDEELIPEKPIKRFCTNMHFYPPKAYLTENALDSNYNTKVIQKYLNYLAPEMANIMIFLKDFNDSELMKVEPCWQTAYMDSEIPKEWIQRWKVIEPLPEFCLPLPNKFLINNLDLIKTPNEKIEKYPLKIYSNSMSELWYSPEFCLPKCCMHFYFISPLKLQSLKNGVLMDMYCILWEQLLAKELYPTKQAEFKFHIRDNINGFTLKMSDLNENLPDITLKDFQDFVKSFTECLYIQCLIQGNITPTAAIKTVQQVIKTINYRPLHPNTIQQLRGTQIPLGISYYKIKSINKFDTSSIITNYYQIGVTTIELSTLISLLIYIMDDKLLEGLRMDKFAFPIVQVRDINGILGYSITVYINAGEYTTEYVDKKIDKFLKWFKNDLEKITEEELDVYKEMFLKSRPQDDANIENAVERNWKEIVKRTYIFDFHEQEILALKKINVNKLREWLADHIPNGCNFRKLSLHIVGTIPKKAKYVYLECINGDHQQYKPNKNHYITKVEDYKKKLFMFPTKRSNKSSQRIN
ncbi:PREDICTED: nardilysin-like [Trachymyrmex cornetzi]|uniref:nardilysin-like n=1 Tax=Trachymyrmex cornetzi TaxID=471704 RepID=UPI00084ED220|nr:PREDICTED: nardilysin-like [Trachymyrmex cornetzi]